MKTIALVDLNSLFVPAWKAIPPTEPASAPHDVTVSRIRRIAEQYDHVAVCIDSPPYDRAKIYQLYKANRKVDSTEQADRDAMRVQLRQVAATLKLDGFAVLGVQGFEADDIIATLVQQVTAWNERETAEEFFSVTIISGDKDLCQLVSPVVSVQSTRYDTTGALPAAVGIDEVLQKFGVPPSMLGDWLAIVGDTSDNVPGVPKIGPKGATTLLAQYGSLDLVLAAAAADDPEMKPAVKRQLVDFEKQARLSRRLVSLRADAPIALDAALKPRVAQPSPKRREDVPQEEKPMPETKSTNENINDGDFEPAKPDATPAPEPAPAKPAEPRRDVAIARYVEPGTDEWAMQLEPRDMRQADWLSKALFDSRLFTTSRGGFVNPEACLAAILLGRSLGLPSMAIVRNCHVIKGKLALHASLIVGLVMKSSLCEYFHCVESTNDRAVYETKRRGAPSPSKLSYTREDAEMAGAFNRRADSEDGAWQKMPRTMLRHRCATELARMVYPDLVAGVYAPEELVDAAEELPTGARAA